MSKNLSNLLIFVVGAAIGSAATYFYANEYHKKRADKEIEEMREYYIGRYDHEEQEEENNDKPKEENIRDYKISLEGWEYVDYSHKATEDEEEEEDDSVDKPYVIPYEEFGELGYREMSLNYYADGVLTDEDDNPIEDIKGTVGAGFYKHFGEYEEDSVYVRNDSVKVDFEILYDTRNYYDIYQDFRRISVEDE